MQVTPEHSTTCQMKRRPEKERNERKTWKIYRNLKKHFSDSQALAPSNAIQSAPTAGDAPLDWRLGSGICCQYSTRVLSQLGAAQVEVVRVCEGGERGGFCVGACVNGCLWRAWHEGQTLRKEDARNEKKGVDGCLCV